jgi:ABC-type polysaccharide/polyol phosphate transport system ATPase subunit
VKRISIKNLKKEFKIGFIKRQTALMRIFGMISGRTPRKKIIAIDDVSFGVNSGDILGLIGKNGSGKSTLLRLVAGIYKQDKGIIMTDGKIISLINLRAGLKNRLTMTDNIYLIGSIFGMSQKTIRKRFASIAKFSQLEKFTNTKLFQFSQGMRQRLVFSIAVHAEPKILLLDEVFELGDKNFKKKSANKIKQLVKTGACVLLVSHELWMIKKYCNRTIWIDKGKIIQKGSTSKIISQYEK